MERFAQVFAEYVQNTSKDKILARLKDATNRKPEEYTIHPGLIELDDIFSMEDPVFVRTALRLFHQVVEGLRDVRKPR